MRQSKEEKRRKRRLYYLKNRDRTLEQDKQYKAMQPEKAKEKQIDTSPATLNLPETFGECLKKRNETGLPCVVVGCKWHVFSMLPIKILGRINKGVMDDDELLDKLFEHETCTLMAANNGIDTLEDIGDMFWVCREMVRQIEKTAKRKVKHCSRRDKLQAWE